jgi:hypothetical protein
LTLKLNVIATLVETQLAGTRRQAKRPASPLKTNKSSIVVAVPATKNNPNSFIFKKTLRIHSRSALLLLRALRG